jgi:hypothetical protein
MTDMSLADAARPGGIVAGQGSASVYAFDEACSILVGWRRRDAVLRLLSADVAVVGGVAGLRPGDSVRLVLHREEVTVRDCRVTRTTLEGVELTRASLQ